MARDGIVFRFFRTGWLLTALLMAVLMLLVPILWPLH